MSIAAPDRSSGPEVDLLLAPKGSDAPVNRWRSAVRTRVLSELEVFLDGNHIDPIGGIAVDDIARHYLTGGKCLRSSFMYLGWLCGAAPSTAAVRAAAALELVHAFALIQDDVMDGSELRRGRPAAHIRFAEEHRDRALPGSASRFGESAATLLGDICLVWSEKMLRDSGIEQPALDRLWPRYDSMRVELALGQFADLLNDARSGPTLSPVLAIARAKSGNYTVRRPLEMGAAMAGCDDGTLAALGRYGDAVGEAFQLRDDLLGVFGAAEITGKPGDTDLGQRKATTVVVAAAQLADTRTRRELTELLAAPSTDAATLARLRTLIAATGAPACIETMIANRIAEARRVLDAISLPDTQRHLLYGMALICTARHS
ncbi:polyprenyl synthetase family protein [Nocardia nova]|uniref:polyprenyl synthetase family protein n=1 Tax=Nocardia nova TaxID=37330 RepID=UPI003F540EFA